MLAVSLRAANAEKPARARQAAAAEAGPMGFERVLTDAQRQEMREFMQAKGANMRENQQKLMQLRRELQETALDGKAEEKFVKEKADEIAKLEAEQLRIRTLALAKVAETFTADQRAQVKEMTERMNAARAPLGGGKRGRNAEEAPRRGEPAAPPPPEK